MSGSILDEISFPQPMSPNEMKAAAEDISSNDESTLSVGTSPIEYYKKDSDGRFVAKVGDVAVITVGSPAEDYRVIRVSVDFPSATEPVFDSTQVSRGRLVLITDAPQELIDSVNKVVTQFAEIADLLTEFNPVL